MMDRLDHARQHALRVAAKYLNDLETLPTSELIENIEVEAYTLARSGEAVAARSLFVAVSDLEFARVETDLS